MKWLLLVFLMSGPHGPPTSVSTSITANESECAASARAAMKALDAAHLPGVALCSRMDDEQPAAEPDTSKDAPQEPEDSPFPGQQSKHKA